MQVITFDGGTLGKRWTVQVIAGTAVQVITFDVGTLPDNATAAQVDAAAAFRDTYLHLTSLLHAIALQTLCQDCDVRNLVLHDSLETEPQLDARRAQLQRAATKRRTAAAAERPRSRSVERELFAETHVGMASWRDMFMLRGRAARGAPLHLLCMVLKLGRN